MVVVGVLALAGCLNVKPVDLAPRLDAPDAEVQKVVRGMRIIVVNHVPRSAMEVVDQAGGAGDAAGAAKAGAGVLPPPARSGPRTEVAFTSKYREAYPTLAHMAEAVPQALRELGFDVATALTVDEAGKMGAPWVLQLAAPEIQAFRRAGGGGLSLEGTVYDAHVMFRGQLLQPDGTRGGVVTGHGQSTTNFRFDDPYLETAVVGAVSLAIMGVVTLAVAVPTAGFFWARRNAETPLAPAGSGSATGTLPCTGVADFDANVQDRAGTCQQAVWLVSAVAAVTGVAVVSALVLAAAQFVGSRVFTGVTALVKSFASEPIWQGMVKSAHDRAARALAAEVARAAGGAP
ncbi:MAG: hypothetical protein HY904_10980 [Deltaproteobacteria bacterium]|nr:hypothetical protein [Deltaproteobacteria bacterium]